MSWREKQVEILYKITTGSRKVRLLLTPVGPIIFFSLTALLILIFLQVDKLLGLPKLFSSPFNLIISIPFFAIGLFLWGWSVLHFIKARGTPVPFNPPPKVVSTGPYAYARNPMLAGIFIFLFGLGILLGSISLVFIFTPLFILFFLWEVKAVEESELEKRLGPDYVEYKKKVPRFFPCLKPGIKKSSAE